MSLAISPRRRPQAVRRRQTRGSTTHKVLRAAALIQAG
jgi:hypothetical protein